MHDFRILLLPLQPSFCSNIQTISIMITSKIFKTTAILALMSFTSTTSQGQDLLARQAPVDRRMKVVDSIALHRLIEIEKQHRRDQFLASKNYRKSVDYIHNVLGWNDGE